MNWPETPSADTFAPIEERESHRLDIYLVQGSLVDARWPTADRAALVRDEVEIVVQVNGKKRGAVQVPAAADAQAAEQAAMADANVRRFLEGHRVRKVVVVPGRLINIVVA